MTPLEELRAFASARGIALHTVQVHRGGEPLIQAACAPLTVSTPQRMYSVTKSLTGLAVGLLVDEGRVELDAPLASYFPDQAPFHPFLAATTVRDALAMRGPHRSTTYKRFDGGWLESYFRVPPTHRPGAVFTYDTSGSYTLAALVERLTGGSLIDYLRPRVLDPLGASAGMRVLREDGVSSGGSGLVCTPDDLSRLAALLLAGGRHGGVRLVSAGYLAQATAKHADTAIQAWGTQLSAGYGLQMWLPAAGGWLMFGLGGQLVFGDPARDLTIVITADTQACPGGDQELVDLVLGRLADAWAAPDAEVERAELSWPAPPHDPTHAVALHGSWAPEAGTELEPLPLTVDADASGGTLSAEGPGGWSVAFACGEPTHVAANTLAAATAVPGPAVVTAGWTDPRTLDLRVDVLGDELAVLRLRLVVGRDGSLTLRRQGFCEVLAPGWNGVGSYAPAP